MNRNAISRLIEVSLFAGIAISLAGPRSTFARHEAAVVTPAAAASKAQAGPALALSRQKVATQKLMRNPWEKTIEVAFTQRRAAQERMYFYW